MKTISNLENRIIKYITKRATTTIADIEAVVAKHGYSADKLYEALEKVHKNKGIKVRNLKTGLIYTVCEPPPKKKPTSTNHYYIVTKNKAVVVPLYEYETIDGITHVRCACIKGGDGSGYMYISRKDI